MMGFPYTKLIGGKFVTCDMQIAQLISFEAADFERKLSGSLLRLNGDYGLWDTSKEAE